MGPLPLTQSGHVHEYFVTLMRGIEQPWKEKKKVLIETRPPACLRPPMLSSTFIHVCTNKQARMLNNQTQTCPPCGELMPSTDTSARHHPNVSPVNLHAAHTHARRHIRHITWLLCTCCICASHRHTQSSQSAWLSASQQTGPEVVGGGGPG